MAHELGMIDNKLLRPAQVAKQCLKPLEKTLKYRENVKLDYERYLSRAEHVRKKDNRSIKEEAALAGHESNLAQAQIDYQTADDQIKETFPPVTEAVGALLPYLLASQVMLQTTLVGQLYTVLEAYCRQEGLPSPAPSDADIIAAWDSDFTAFRRELEQGLEVVANGKAVKMGMALPEKKEGTITGLGLRNKVMNRTKSGQSGVPQLPMIGSRRSSNAVSTHEQEDDEPAPPKPPRPGRQSSFGMPSPSINLASKPRIPSGANTPGGLSTTWEKPQTPSASWIDEPIVHSNGSTPASRYHTPVNGASTPLTNSAPDYFAINKNRSVSQSSMATSPSTALTLANAASMAAGKKKPPPIPTKRIPSQQTLFVTAIYDFEGQAGGDLTFEEGDRIRVIKKTDSMDDWWEGELRGQAGSFPANYVQV